MEATTIEVNTGQLLSNLNSKWGNAVLLTRVFIEEQKNKMGRRKNWLAASNAKLNEVKKGLAAIGYQFA